MNHKNEQVQEELKEISPLLAKLPVKRYAGDMPEGFFDQHPKKVMDLIRNQPKKGGIFQLKSFRLAVAASFALVLGSVAIFQMVKPTLNWEEQLPVAAESFELEWADTDVAWEEILTDDDLAALEAELLFADAEKGAWAEYLKEESPI